MLHITLPIRPDTKGPYQRIISPLSAFIIGNDDKRVLLTTSLMNRNSRAENLSGYLEIVEKLGLNFDYHFDDSEIDFLSNLQDLYKLYKSYTKEICISTCECGGYFEIDGGLFYNKKEVIDGRCVRCNTEITVRTALCEIFDVNFDNVTFTSTNKSWVIKDFKHFLSRKNPVMPHLLFESGHNFFLGVDNHESKIRFSILWASFIMYVCKQLGDNEINIHYVNKSQDKVFIIASFLKHIFPEVKISLTALPIVWPKNPKPLYMMDSTDLNNLGRVINSNRKTINF